ncbi:Hypothetical protein PBC10988_37290 [Planctomycetales bacterium 10988]|nr:Hypothetical protein PBC10988_37290 [Planctomycetales bacterium 10988]
MILKNTFWFLIWLGLCCYSASGFAERQEIGKFNAFFLDGERINAAEIEGWSQGEGEPSINQKALFDSENPARWVLNRLLETGHSPEVLVEFWTGDCLPGEVTGYRYGLNHPIEQRFPHVIVDCPLPVGSPDQPWMSGRIRVRTEAIRRVVWQPRGGSGFQPGTLFLRDGSQIVYRALRWTERGIELLREEGTVSVSFSQIAELHFLRPPAWEPMWEQLASLSPDGKTRLIQLETASGLLATTSRDRLSLEVGTTMKAVRFHRIQPAWSLDPLWVPLSTISCWRFFAPHEVLLSNLEPQLIEQTPILAGYWQVQKNRSVLQISFSEFSPQATWGLGVLGNARLTFSLPPFSKNFTCRGRLDPSVGAGGCVQCRILWRREQEEKVLFESPVLVGSQESFETPQLSLSKPEKKVQQTQLLLEVNSTPEERPQGADPFDIRDALNWIEPLLVLDPKALQAILKERYSEQIPAWNQWQSPQFLSGKLSLKAVWEKGGLEGPSYDWQVQPTEESLQLVRELIPTEDQKWLVINTTRPEASPPCQLRVEANGKPLVEKWEIPTPEATSSVDPLTVPLQDYLDQKVTLRLIQSSEASDAAAQWKAISFLDQPLGLRRLFEDDPIWLNQFEGEENQLSFIAKSAFSGQGSLQLQAGSLGNTAIQDWNYSINNRPDLGEFRYLRFAWKTTEGANIELQLAASGKWDRQQGSQRQEGNERVLQYRAGPDRSENRYVKQIGFSSPTEWTIITRDLASDFGSFKLTGLQFHLSEGSTGWIDHIYLARKMSDFEYLDPELVNP